MRGSAISAHGGFTIVEVLVAMFLLIVAGLGTAALIDRANAVSGLSNQRVSASTLGRELIEDARSLDYDTLTTALLPGELQDFPGLSGTGNPWHIRRRGIDYTVSVAVCVFDDPKDGIASTPPANVCPSSGGGSGTDQNGDDFRRVTVNLSWSSGPMVGAGHALTVTGLIVNPSGGLAPRLTVASPSPPQITTPSLATLNIGATTSSPAASVHWAADDGVSQGNATGGPTSWTVPWSIGSTSLPCLRPSGSNTYVLDGAYSVTVQDFDDRGVQGDSKVASVMLNRCLPFAPAGFTGGHDTRLGGIVDLQWDANPERDVVGYRVYDLGANGTYDPGSDRLVCENLDPPATTCTDTSSDVTSLTTSRVYGVVALDRADLNDTGSALRAGAMATFSVPKADSSPPSWPSGTTLSVAVIDGLPRLTWSQAATGGSGSIAFYRIYRDKGTGLDGRYDRTAGPTTNWTDTKPGDTTAHTYWVTAVDSRFDESDPLGPVTGP